MNDLPMDDIQFRRELGEGKSQLLVIREDEWRELYKLVQKTSSIIGKIEERVNMHETILNNPINGVVARISEMEKSMTDKFHKIELEMTKQLSEIRANEESRYNSLKENHTKQITEQQDKFMEKFDKVALSLTNHMDALDARLVPLEEKKVASWASWQTLAIIMMALGEIILIGSTVIQAWKTH